MKKRLALSIGVLTLVIILAVPLMPYVRAQGGETATVTSLRAPLHTEPSAQSETIVTLARGTLVDFLGFDESLAWVSVRTADRTEGWVSTAYLRLNGPYVPVEDGITSTVVDGVADDWDRFTRPFEDEIGDSAGTIDIQAVRSFMSEEYLYVLVEATGNLRDARLLLVDLVTNTGNVYATYQFALPRDRVGTLFVVTAEEGESRDASGVVDYRESVFEFRMPLELLDYPNTLNIVNVEVQELTDAGLVTTDTLEQVMPTVVTQEVEAQANAVVIDARINLRVAPVNGRVLRVLAPGEELSILGRTADGGWLYVRLADTFQGWITSEFVETDIDLTMVPVKP